MKQRRRSRRAGRGTLTVIALLMGGSAALRAVDGAGQALAEASEARGAGTEAPARSTLATAAKAVFDPEGIAELLTELKTREAEIARREQELDRRFAELDAAEAMIADNLAALTAAEERLQGTLALADGAMEDDIARLTRVYESMKPKQAAALFEKMDPTFAAGFLARMDPAAAAGILAGLTPETAYGISILYAVRNEDVPRN